MYLCTLVRSRVGYSSGLFQLHEIGLIMFCSLAIALGVVHACTLSQILSPIHRRSRPEAMKSSLVNFASVAVCAIPSFLASAFGDSERRSQEILSRRSLPRENTAFGFFS